MKYVIRPAARNDILRQHRYYLLEGAHEAARRFMDAVHTSIRDLCQHPEMGAPKAFKNIALSGPRSWPVKDFEDRIYYLAQRDALRVVRILHGRRDVQSILETESKPGKG